jgi:hypothetical protein
LTAALLCALASMLMHGTPTHTRARAHAHTPPTQQQVKEQINDPATQRSIHDASLAACAQLPAGLMQDACTSFVEQYGARLCLCVSGVRCCVRCCARLAS